MSASNPHSKAGSIAIDSSAIISLFRGHEKAAGCFNQAQEIWMPVTVLGELYCGLHKCNNPEKERMRIGDMRSRCLAARDDHFARIEGLQLIAL